MSTDDVVTADWSVQREGGVTAVACVLHNRSPVTRRVTVTSECDGPVWPPRRRGVPEPGWDENRYTTTIDPETRLAVGFASPAPPGEPPVDVTDHGRADGETGDHGRADSGMEAGASPEAVRQCLPDPRPPRDVLGGGRAVSAGPPAVGSDSDGPDPDECGASGGSDPADADGAARSGPPASRSDTADLPPAVADWLSAVESRLDRIEPAAQATDVPEATAALDRAGGLDGLATTSDRLADDAERLRRLATRADDLADRIDRTTAAIPRSTLRRIA